MREGVAHPLKSVDPLWDGTLVGPVGRWLSCLTLGNGGTRTAPATGFEKRGQRFDHSRLNKTHWMLGYSGWGWGTRRPSQCSQSFPPGSPRIELEQRHRDGI